MRQEGRNPDFFNRRNLKKRGKKKGKWGPPFSHKAPNATIQIPELFRLAGGERSSHHADITTIILLHNWWTHRCRDLLRRYQWAQIPTDLTRNPYHKQDDTGMFQKVLLGKFSIRIIWMRSNSPNDMLSLQHVRLHFNRWKGKSRNHIEWVWNSLPHQDPILLLKGAVLWFVINCPQAEPPAVKKWEDRGWGSWDSEALSRSDGWDLVSCV